MKAFIRSLCLFLLPLLLLGVAMLWVSVPAAFNFARIEQDCRNGNWLYHRMYDNPAPIDAAFIGSSRTMCAVNDGLLSGLLSTQMPEPFEVANMGFCRLGRSLHYALGSTLLTQKRPRLLIVEVRENEERFSHPDFPYLASGSELLFPHLWLNAKYPEQVSQGTQHRIRYWRNHLLGIPPDPDTTQADRRYSFLPTDPKLATLADAGKIPATRPVRIQPPAPPASWGYALNQQYPRSYLNSIARLAAEQSVTICFLYLPGFNSASDQLPLELDVYRSIGPVWIPPERIFLEAGNWSDEQHLNGKGAEQLSRWLVDKMLTQVR